MWYLTSQSDSRIIYIYTENKEIVIGRGAEPQICNFTILEDASISRKHAVLMLIDKNLYIRDLGSRYGTFINESGVTLESNTKLNNNDVIKFGKLNSVWKVNEISFVTCTSTLKGENLQTLKVCLNNIGVTFLNEWDDSCKYLTMPAITLTIKVVLALVQGSYIVVPDFWNKCWEAVCQNQPLPDPNNFTPQIIESTLNKENVSFAPNSKRHSLFSGKKVVFFSKRQFEMYKPILTKSSATALLFSESKFSINMLCESDVIVIQYNMSNISQETQTLKEQIIEIIGKLKDKGKRVVADAEIGLAILYCSLEKNCNPDFNLTSEVIKVPLEPNKISNVLAEESQETKKNIVNCKTENVLIDETFTDVTEKNSKRKLSGDDNMNVNKKMAIDSNVSSYNSKRKLNDESEIDNNPTKKQAIEKNNALFNFVDDDVSKVSEKKIIFTKPQKRKHETVANDENLFNFIQDSSNSSQNESRKQTLLNINDDSVEEIVQPSKKTCIEDEKVDISALRGVKLRELMDNVNLDIPHATNIKKEVTDDLDKKMEDLALGATIVTVRNNLIVKKEPIEIEEPCREVKNFKKFKKVWPVKMQVTIISKSSMSIYKDKTANDFNFTSENGIE